MLGSRVRESPCIGTFKAMIIPMELVSIACQAEMVLVDFMEVENGR